MTKYKLRMRSDVFSFIQNTVPSDTREVDEATDAFHEAEEDVGKLICPICNIEFERTPENAQKLVVHVDEHLVEELKCPVCFITFNISHQNAYENHVNVSKHRILLFSNITIIKSLLPNN